jgi:cellulose synthase/poly-beta-1,6-N-acetylglucosamine synthase-like glycosyltransferase
MGKNKNNGKKKNGNKNQNNKNKMNNDNDNNIDDILDEMRIDIDKENEALYSNMPFVSVCTPTFNRRPFISGMIKCFDHQTYPKSRIEWIIIDDGTDKIEDLVKNHSCV